LPAEVAPTVSADIGDEWSNEWSSEDFYKQLEDLLSIKGVFVTKEGDDLIEKLRDDWQLVDRQEAVRALIQRHADDFASVSALVMADAPETEMSTIADLRRAVEPITSIIETISTLNPPLIEDVGNS
jgi:hypothetical protein